MKPEQHHRAGLWITIAQGPLALATIAAAYIPTAPAGLFRAIFAAYAAAFITGTFLIQTDPQKDEKQNEKEIL